MLLNNLLSFYDILGRLHLMLTLKVLSLCWRLLLYHVFPTCLNSSVSYFLFPCYILIDQLHFNISFYHITSYDFNYFPRNHIKNLLYAVVMCYTIPHFSCRSTRTLTLQLHYPLPNVLFHINFMSVCAHGWSFHKAKLAAICCGSSMIPELKRVCLLSLLSCIFAFLPSCGLDLKFYQSFSWFSMSWNFPWIDE